MTRYLLDTNVISELRKRKPQGAVVAWIDSLREEQIFVSAATMGEIQSGIERARRQDPAKATEMENWMIQMENLFPFLPMDVACFREWARMMDGRSGTLEPDAMIAATARVHGLTVATRNEKDFKHFDVEIFNPFKFI